MAIMNIVIKNYMYSKSKHTITITKEKRISELQDGNRTKECHNEIRNAFLYKSNKLNITRQKIIKKKKTFV